MAAKKKAEKLPPTNYEQIERLLQESGIPAKKADAVMTRIDKTYDVLHQKRVQDIANGMMDWLSSHVDPSGQFPATMTELQMALLLVQMKTFEMFKARNASRAIKALGKILEDAAGHEHHHDDEAPPEYERKEVPKDIQNIYG